MAILSKHLALLLLCGLEFMKVLISSIPYCSFSPKKMKNTIQKHSITFFLALGQIYKDVQITISLCSNCHETNTCSLFFYFVQFFAFPKKSSSIKLKMDFSDLKKNGKVIAEPSYSYIFPFSEGFAVMIRDGKYGYLNSEGKVQLSPQFDGAWEFDKGIAKVCRKCRFSIEEGGFVGGKWGYVNKSADELVPIIYSYIGDFTREGLAVVKGEKGFGFVDRAGRVAVFPTYAECQKLYRRFCKCSER